ncbi:MAG: hypothetical protein ACOC1S_03040 [bacterium]
MSEGKIKNFFPGSNTVQGFYSFYEYLPHNAENIFIIKGGPGTGKSTTMKNIGKIFKKNNLDIEYHWCSSDNQSLDGVVIPTKKVALFDGTAPHEYDPQYPGAVGEIVNFGQYWDKNELQKNKAKIKDLFQVIENYFNKAYNRLRRGELYYQEIEKQYQKKYETTKTFRLINKITTEIVPADTQVTNKGPERHLFGSAITPGGYIDSVQELTDKIKKCYLLQGKPDSEASKIINNTGQYIQTHGYYVLYLHSGFKPDLIDAIISPELDFALIRKAKPYNVQNHHKNFNLINNNNHQEDKINNYIKKAVNNLKKAKQKHDQLEEYYIQAMDFQKINDLETTLVDKISAL